MRVLRVVGLFVFMFGLFVCGTQQALGDVFVDDFEDDSINTSIWDFGGERRGYAGAPAGSWTYTHTETVHHTGDPDGYLQMRVTGPASANTYGADAWLQTDYDYNDDEAHMLNFTWEPEYIDNHENAYYIQITDGYTNPTADYHWAEQDYVETVNLLHSPGKNGWFLGESSPAPPGPGKFNWSIKIDPSGMASLYEGENGTGVLRSQKALVAGSEWYVRFMVTDGTSSGFPAGDARFNLHSFTSVPEPSTFTLLTMGVVGLLAFARRKRR